MVRALILALLTGGLVACAEAELELPPLYREVAAYAGVPQTLLYAMAKTESGRLVGGEFEPWPWTLNVEGDAHYYGSRNEMYSALMEALRAGKLKVDIGPMQINWYWQYRPETSPWRLTEPGSNLKMAAQILKSHYQGHGDWLRAAGQYHRPREATQADRQRAMAYRRRVMTFMPDAQWEATDGDR